MGSAQTLFYIIANEIQNMMDFKIDLAQVSEIYIFYFRLTMNRGRHPTIDPQIKQRVIDFINSIPTIESLNLRAQTTREFISSEKSLTEMDYLLPRLPHLTGYSTPISIFLFLSKSMLSVVRKVQESFE